MRGHSNPDPYFWARPRGSRRGAVLCPEASRARAGDSATLASFGSGAPAPLGRGRRAGAAKERQAEVGTAWGRRARGAEPVLVLGPGLASGALWRGSGAGDGGLCMDSACLGCERSLGRGSRRRRVRASSLGPPSPNTELRAGEGEGLSGGDPGFRAAHKWVLPRPLWTREDREPNEGPLKNFALLLVFPQGIEARSIDYRSEWEKCPKSTESEGPEVRRRKPNFTSLLCESNFRRRSSGHRTLPDPRLKL